MGISHEDKAIEALRCKYKGRACTKPRAFKSENKLHNLCQEHRHKANDTQNKSQQKKKLRQGGDQTERPVAEDQVAVWTATPKNNVDTQAHAVASRDRLTCRYSNGKGCVEPRTLKSPGQLHRYCQRHRDAANKYQRTYKAKHPDRIPTYQARTPVATPFLRVLNCDVQPDQVANLLEVVLRGDTIHHHSEKSVASPRVASFNDRETLAMIATASAEPYVMANLEPWMVDAILNSWLRDFLDEVFESVKSNEP